jgi:DNA-binding TFAR19-related protein (PDSD5 family)
MNGNGVSLEELQQLKQIEAVKRQILNQVLSKEAFERLGRVRTVNPDLAGQVELYLVQIYQSGKVKDKISDSKLKDVLRLLSVRKDFRIKRV